MKQVFLITLLIMLVSCGTDDAVNDDDGWLLPQTNIFDGGPGRDGIPAIDEPEMATIGGVGLEYLQDGSLVLVYRGTDEVRIYPHNILDYHEIVNDQIGEDHVAITYCPLTGTGVGWGRVLNGEVTSFGVSGLLFETNLMPFDRLTGSLWSQMFNQCITGDLVETRPEFFNLTQMNYATAKTMFPDALVLTSNTGFNRNYTSFPYGAYKADVSVLFPVTNVDRTIHPKSVVRGVEIEGSAVAFQLPNSLEPELTTHTLNGKEIIAVADLPKKLIVTFLNREIESTPLEFTLLDDDPRPDVILQDQLGNKWNVLGEAVEGPNAGLTLEIPYSYNGYWFAWASFYPDIVLAN